MNHCRKLYRSVNRQDATITSHVQSTPYYIYSVVRFAGAYVLLCCLEKYIDVTRVVQ